MYKKKKIARKKHRKNRLRLKAKIQKSLLKANPKKKIQPQVEPVEAITPSKDTTVKEAPEKKPTTKKKTVVKKAPSKKKTVAKKAPSKKKTVAKKAPAKKKTAAKKKD